MDAERLTQTRTIQALPYGTMTVGPGVKPDITI
jgi:hypothetical protein